MRLQYVNSPLRSAPRFSVTAVRLSASPISTRARRGEIASGLLLSMMSRTLIVFGSQFHSPIPFVRTMSRTMSLEPERRDLVGLGALCRVRCFRLSIARISYRLVRHLPSRERRSAKRQCPRCLSCERENARTLLTLPAQTEMV